MNVKPIAAATDGSEESLRAVEWAASEAILHAALLRIVSAAPPPPVMTALQIRPDRDHVADFIRSEQDLALPHRSIPGRPGGARSGDRDPPGGWTARPGSRRERIRRVDAGGRLAGSRAFTALTLGSVSRYAAAHAACPVVVIRDLPPVASGLVGVGVGDLEDCAGPLTFAFEEASLRKAAVLALHACGRPSGPAADARLAELVESWADSLPASRSASRSCPATRPGP